ncbi:p450 domain-containing protein [Cephalotus follicularis]|uniref:p450 domain-containing protein n=1 Tax=Cephalotus follicularis TaxID=3775 RepID=A0A1Q3C526_CEPFO|nr:p450 domain-containing protein [Cephalotus follicularis]
MIYEEVIQKHLDPSRPKPQHEDLVDVLLRIQKDTNQAINISSKQIKGVLVDMFIAGTDTSAATLVWIMCELIRNPLVMRRVQVEVREVAKGKLKVEESDLPRLVYMKAVIKETWRLHPPVPLLVPRETLEECGVGGYRIPCKTRVLVDARLIGKDPKYWENPNEFQPERFLESSIDYRGKHFEFIPFGVGRRGCPGINFAVPIVEFALANLLFRFDWQLTPGEILDMDAEFGLTMIKKIPLCLLATCKSS